jgi:tetratricopeptide (TPR) repeat protein
VWLTYPISLRCARRCSVSTIGWDCAARFLFGLLVMGVIEYDPPLSDGPFRVGNILRDHADRLALENMQEKTVKQTYARIRTQNPHEVLGITPHASRKAIERAYSDAKALFGRDRLLPRVQEKFRSELGVIESRLVEAYLQLTQPARRTPSVSDDGSPDKHEINVNTLLVRPELERTKTQTAEDEAGRVAELYYDKARGAMRSGDYHNAIQFGKLAVSYKTDARFFFLLAECQMRNPEARWQRMAEENYTRSTQLDPWNPAYWVSLGRFYKKRGLALRARRQFEEALKIAPGHEEASRELASLR